MTARALGFPALAFLCVAVSIANGADGGSGSPAPPNFEPAPEGLDARELAQRSEVNMRGDTSYIDATMTVVSPRLPAPRDVHFNAWDDRPGKRSFIRILSPPKDAETAFLMLTPNLWMFVPRVERTVRIPPSMMLQSWMGSDFTNDDLVKSSSVVDDYEQRLLGIDRSPPGPAGSSAYVIEYLPHESAPVVWGRIIAWIETEHLTPLLQEFYDEEGAKVRLLQYDDIREIEGRRYPYRWKGTTVDKPGHSTRIQVHEIHFDLDLDEKIFTTSHLKRRRR